MINMVWVRTLEDSEHTARRVFLFKNQNMPHEAIDTLFESEQKAELEQQEQRKQTVQEVKVQKAIDLELSQQQAEINDKKMKILETTEQEIKKMEKTYDDAETLAYFLRKDYFDRIPPNTENSVIIIGTQKGKDWSFLVQATPNPIDISKIKKIDIIQEES